MQVTTLGQSQSPALLQRPSKPEQQLGASGRALDMAVLEKKGRPLTATLQAPETLPESEDPCNQVCTLLCSLPGRQGKGAL